MRALEDSLNNVGLRHIQYQGETIPPFPLVLAFHLVLGKFHIYAIPNGCTSGGAGDVLTRTETDDLVVVIVPNLL